MSSIRTIIITDDGLKTCNFFLLTVSITFLVKLFDKGGRPRGKHDGVIRHFSKRKNVNRMDKLCFCVIDPSGIQPDWVNLRENEFQEISGREMWEKPT